VKKILSFFLVIVLGLVFISCDEQTPPDIKPLNIEIIGKSEIEVGVSIMLEAIVTPNSAVDKSVTWKSSDINIAIVNKGIVKGIKEGKTTIIATSNADKTVFGEFEITVLPKKVEEVFPASIEITGRNSVEVGSDILLKSYILPEDAVNKEVVWYSSDDEIATVKDGLVTGISEGDAVIVVESKANKEIFAEYPITVNEPIPIFPTCLIITNQRYKHYVNEVLDLDVKVYPSNSTDKNVVWAVDNEQIAVINEKGLLTPVSTGKVKVTVTSVSAPDISHSIEIELVKNKDEADVLVENLTITSNQESYLLNDFIDFELVKEFEPASATNKNVYWSSSNKEVVGIDEETRTPYIRGVGKATLICYSVANPEVYGMIDIIIDDYISPTSIKLVWENRIELSNESIYVGRTRQINVQVDPYNGDPRMTYISSNPDIATVDENGLINAYKAGVVTITATSVRNPEIVLKYEIEVKENEPDCGYPVGKLIINSQKSMYIGYKNKIDVIVYPVNASQEVLWEIHPSSSGLATIDENGVVTALKLGTLRVRAVSAVDSTNKSSYLSINILEVPEPYAVGDMKGYEIIIMTVPSNIGDIDPFVEAYTNPDKLHKQKALKEAEELYNCKINFKSFPDISTLENLGITYVEWLIDNALAGKSYCDLAYYNSYSINELANANAICDVSEMYGKYGLGQMDEVLKTAGSYKGKLYIASTGISKLNSYVDLGLYYNYGWLKELGVESPAKLFNEGKWTYCNFKEWVLDVQSKLGENEYALGGEPYSYWLGMSNAAGQILLNSNSYRENLTSIQSIEATSLINSLVNAKAFNPYPTWASDDDIPNSFWRSDGGGTLMTTGYMCFVNKYYRWAPDMWGEGTTEFGYVPFPYPDDISKSATRIGTTDLEVYIYVAGREYTKAMGSEGYKKVWVVMNDVFLNTVKYQEEDPLFDPETIIETNMSKLLSDPESIEAYMYYDLDKTFYEGVGTSGSGLSSTSLIEPLRRIIISGSDYMEEFNKLYEKDDRLY